VTNSAHGELAAGATWALSSAEDRKQGWRPGGLQPIAVHASSGRLFAIMHQGGTETHKDPGSEVWVYDLGSKRLLQRIIAKNPIAAIQVSRDNQPLLFGAFMGSSTIDVYDAISGAHLRSIDSIGTTPTLLVNP
jgi:methylamine dehydrogenase heavy chain